MIVSSSVHCSSCQSDFEVVTKIPDANSKSNILEKIWGAKCNCPTCKNEYEIVIVLKMQFQIKAVE